MTRLFEFIAHHGHKATERRAHKAHPNLANRQKSRHKGKYVEVTAGPGGIDGFFHDMELELKHRPWWWSATLHIHWWMGKHGPRAIRSDLRQYHQRGKRGWSNRDTWGLDHYLATVIRDSVRHLKDISHGYPGTPAVPTFEDWTRILDEIADGMQAHLDMSETLPLPGSTEEKELVAARDLAFDHLKAHFGSLWD